MEKVKSYRRIKYTGMRQEWKSGGGGNESRRSKKKKEKEKRANSRGDVKK